MRGVLTFNVLLEGETFYFLCIGVRIQPNLLYGNSSSNVRGEVNIQTISFSIFSRAVTIEAEEHC